MRVPLDIFAEARDYGDILVETGCTDYRLVLCKALVLNAYPEEEQELRPKAAEFMQEALDSLDVLAATGRAFPLLHRYLTERLAA